MKPESTTTTGQWTPNSARTSVAVDSRMTQPITYNIRAYASYHVVWDTDTTEIISAAHVRTTKEGLKDMKTWNSTPTSPSTRTLPPAAQALLTTLCHGHRSRGQSLTSLRLAGRTSPWPSRFHYGGHGLPLNLTGQEEPTLPEGKAKKTKTGGGNTGCSPEDLAVASSEPRVTHQRLQYSMNIRIRSNSLKLDWNVDKNTAPNNLQQT